MRLLRTDDVAERLGVHRSTVWRWRRKGILPKPRQVGPNTVGWTEKDLDEWMQARPQKGDSGEAA